jgi:hypothetical protein
MPAAALRENVVKDAAEALAALVLGCTPRSAAPEPRASGAATAGLGAKTNLTA